MSVFAHAFHHVLAPIDLGAMGGLLLLLDMVLFAALAAKWEDAGRLRLRPIRRKR